MAHINEQSSVDLKIRTVLSGGRSLPAGQAAHDIAELFASDVERSLSEHAPGLPLDDLHDVVRGVLEQRLKAMLAPGATSDAASGYRSLPVTNMKPSEVVLQGKLRVSLASLYRYVDANRFYCVVPSGQTNGREFPAWQFFGPVPELLQPVLTALRGALRTEVHAFFVTEQDELNELAPAEVLAGSAFETCSALHESQIHILALPAVERQRRVLALLQDREDAWPLNG